MSEQEAGILRSTLDTPRSFFGARSPVGTYVGGCLAGLLGGAVPASLLATIGSPWAFWTWVGFGLAGLRAAHFLYRRSLRGAEAERAPYSADLEAGRIEEIACCVARGVVIEEAEDEGLGCLLDLGDRDILFLHGQYLYEPVDEHHFPAERVRIARARKTRAVLTFEYEGNPLRGVPRVPPTALRRPLADGDLLKGQLGDYLSLDQQLQEGDEGV